MIWHFKKTTPPMKASDQWRVTGLGGDYGREWSDHLADDDPVRRAYLDWLGGFFSGLSLAENINFFRDHDFNVCRAAHGSNLSRSPRR